jgi:hypothetical protein
MRRLLCGLLLVLVSAAFVGCGESEKARKQREDDEKFNAAVQKMNQGFGRARASDPNPGDDHK